MATADNRYRHRRGIVPPVELTEKISALLGALGPRAASRRLRIHREQLISVAAGVPVLAGTIALVQQRLAESEGA
jgi:hypothetical protein